MTFLEELDWRGMLHQVMPETDELLQKEMTTGYIGFDPTADSLHVGSLAPIMILMHLQRAGHRPIAVLGGATGRIGDPSGKTAERSLLSEEELEHNLTCIKRQLSHFLDFDCGDNSALVVNNYEWMKSFSFLDFIRDVGKHITINYMLAKDSVKSRMETGLSFTEFSYQLLQGYDFMHLYKEYNCKLQLGGSDQWGNITTGTELIRRIAQGSAFAATTPLITKADGGKFGKSESDNVWLDPKLTSPYKFYQFWMNCTDEDAEKFIKVFTLLDQPTVNQLIEEHRAAPHQRILQKTIAEDVTVRVHGREAYDTAVSTSNILFGKSSKADLLKLNGNSITEVFEGVPTFSVSKNALAEGVDIVEFLATETGVLASKGEARRALKENSISINKEKVSGDATVASQDLLDDKFVVVQRGKKNYFLIVAE